MKFHPALLFLALLSSSNQHKIVKRDASQGGQKKVVCYYTNWSVYRPGTAKFNPQNINPYLCTHLIYAFGGLDRENGLRPYDKYQDIEQGGYAKFTGLKSYNKALKTMLAIGGWNEGSARFSPLVADEERRKEFVKNVVKFLRVNHFDGLDLDWEYPAFRDGGKAHDKENYAQLVQELREEFERESSKTGRVRLLLSMAVPAGIEYIDKGYDIPKLNKYLDFMNILSYDYHSAFEPSVNHHSPLYSLEEESEYNYDSQLTIDATVKHYLMKGADANKLVLGIPTYGRSYTLFNEASTDLGAPADGPGEQGEATREKGYLAYYEICSKVKDDWIVVHPKDTAMGPYAYKGTQWVGYDDENIVRKKSQYVNEKQLGGIMIWSIDNDDFRGNCHQRAYPLIEAAKEVLLGKAAVGKQALSAGRSSKTSSSKPGKLKNQRSSTTAAPSQSKPTVTTPEPPTTPDPGSDFVCKDEGFFPHPRDCKKYFWCLDSGPSNLGIVAHQFTCPSGLFFNKAADSCDFARNVICKKKSTTTTSTTTTSTTTTSTTTTTATRSPVGRVTSSDTSTTPLPLLQQDYEEDDSEEDPQTIKQLINLIKKLGGVDELEKQLEGTAGSDATTPSISKTLYDRVLNKATPKYQTVHRNGPSGPQNEGLTRETVRAPYRRDKPQYVTIRRERPTTTTESSAEYADIDEIDEPDDSVPEERPNYKGLYHSRHTDKESDEDSGPPTKSERHFRPKYQPAERFRPKHQHTEDKQEASTLKYTNLIRSRPSTLTDHASSTSKYVTLHRQKPQHPQELGTTENYGLDGEDVSEEQLADLETTTTSTSRPRVKVSALLTTTPRILTSTRVVTQIVEGSTQRQRVPLHRLHELLLDADNLIKSSTKPDLTAQTTKKRIFNRLIRKRPSKLGSSAISSSTTTEYPLNQRNQQIRPPAEDNIESHNVTTISKKRSHGFVPSRTRIRTNSPKEQNNYNRSEENHITRFPSTTEKATEVTNGGTKLFLQKKSGTESSNTLTRSFIRAKRPIDEDREDGSDPLLSREFSRESSIVRRPVFRHVTGNASIEQTTRDLFTLPHIGNTIAINTENYSDTVNVMRIKNMTATRDVVVTEGKKNETKFGIQFNTSRQHKSDDHSFTIKDLSSSTTSQPITPVENNTESDVAEKVIAEAIVPTTERITTEYFYTSMTGEAVQESNQSQTIKRNITKRVLRRKLIVQEKKNLTILASTTQTIPKEKNKIKIIRRISDKRLAEKRQKIESTTAAAITQKKLITSRGKTKYYHSRQQKSSVDERRKENEAISAGRRIVLPTESPAVHHTTLPVKRKRILIRGKKNNKQATNIKVESSIGDGQLRSTLQLQKREDGKVRRVVLKKIARDLAVGETGVPKLQRNTYEIENPKKLPISRGSLKMKDSLLKEELEFTKTIYGNTSSEIGRVRRPVNKRLISRGSTSTSTSAPITASTQRSTALTLAHRLNKFKMDKTLPRPSIISAAEGNRTTLHPRKTGFRRVVRPIISSQNIAEDSQLGESYSRSVSKDTGVTFEKGQFPGEPSGEESERDGQIDESVEELVADSETTGQPVAADDDVNSKSVSLDKKQSSGLPDLANVAVAAIQSLATSVPPTDSTVKYKSTLAHAAGGKDVLNGKARPSSRPGRPFRPSTRPGITRTRSSSPRPFSKSVQQSTTPTRASASPHRTSLIYEDYDADYYAEPVDLPLSGKVRIHTDGYIECLDIGNFPHPFSCRKFISCAKMENGRLLGWEYTCPKGLSFDPIGGICNWNAGLGCKE